MNNSEIVIKNLRSFDNHGDVIKVGEMAEFVGKNSSGKSSILQALQLFFGQTSPTLDDFYYLPFEISFDAYAGFITADYMVQVEVAEQVFRYFDGLHMVPFCVLFPVLDQYGKS